MTTKRRRFRVGTEVRLIGKKRRAKIIQFFSDIKGGVVLDKYLGGFRCWNVENLERAPE